MEPIQFRKSLFGFSREQVMDYIAKMDRKAQDERQALMEEHSARLDAMRKELEAAEQRCGRYQREAERAAAQAIGLQQQVDALNEQIEASALLRQRLEETEAEREEWRVKYASLEEEMERSVREALERENRLSEFIDRVQEKNVELLQKQVAMEIRLSSAERQLCSSAARSDGEKEQSGAQMVDQSAREEIIAALDAILTKLDALGPQQETDAYSGRVFRIAEQK